jgi:hypothetical protein
MNDKLKIIAFANCAGNGAPWLITPYPESEVSTFIHTEGLLRLMKGYTIICQDIHPPLKHKMPVLTPIDLSKIDAFIWSPLVDECVGISMLKDTDGHPYPIDSGDSHKIFPPGPLYHEETLKLFWIELDNLTRCVHYRFVITYPTTHLITIQGVQNPMKLRVEKLNKLSYELLTSLGWIHYELDDELAEDKYWSHFSERSRNELYKKIERDLGI